MNAIRINCLLHVTRTIDNDKGRTIGKVMGWDGGGGGFCHAWTFLWFTWCACVFVSCCDTFFSDILSLYESFFRKFLLVWIFSVLSTPPSLL